MQSDEESLRGGERNGIFIAVEEKEQQNRLLNFLILTLRYSEISLWHSNIHIYVTKIKIMLMNYVNKMKYNMKKKSKLWRFLVY